MNIPTRENGDATTEILPHEEIHSNRHETSPSNKAEN
jgi:hypothetical protein